MTLKNISHIRPLYFLPDKKLVTDVLVPGFQLSKSVKCMMGFFTSHSLAQIAPGLSEFLQSDNSEFKLIISPHIYEDDWQAIVKGKTILPEFLEERIIKLIGEAIVSENALVNHTLECLSYLISINKIEIRISILNNASFHPKIWLFDDHDAMMAVHGSSNMTDSGLRTNYEQVSISCNWVNSNEEITVSTIEKEFKTVWFGKKPGVFTFCLTDAIKKNLAKIYSSSQPPTYDDFLSAWHKERADVSECKSDVQSSSNENRVSKIYFEIPEWLNYWSGDFGHQGKAVQSWMDSGSNGILEMATGSGKTITALIAAYKLYQECNSLMIVIAAPYMPLINQWYEETKVFSLEAAAIGLEGSRKAKINELSRQIRSLRLGNKHISCIIVSHDFLCDEEFQSMLGKEKFAKLIIADEVHNLGRKQFISTPPNFFGYRLGLSATPVRQFDETGTQFLQEFFGDVVFRFGLEDAIGVCLTPYNYYVHPVIMTEDELSEWYFYTDKIKKMSWNFEDDEPSEYLESLLRKRRLILESAKNKLERLRELLEKHQDIHHTLIYTTDKDPEQLIYVNNLLKELSILFHQVTSEETKNAQLTSDILSQFADGKLKILTAKRVLDEGVNIPEIQNAFILASTTVERQWIQRRGRLLRKCDRIGKKNAEIHDFLVMPSKDSHSKDRDLRKILEAELKRINSFAELANNAAASDGPLAALEPIYNRYFSGGSNVY